MHYPKPRNQYWVADHYKNGHVPQKNYNTEINMQSSEFKPQVLRKFNNKKVI